MHRSVYPDELIKKLLDEFRSKKKSYNHYTEKIKKLEKEKETAELSGKTNYTKEDLQKLLRVAALDQEREEADGGHHRAGKEREDLRPADRRDLHQPLPLAEQTAALGTARSSSSSSKTPLPAKPPLTCSNSATPSCSRSRRSTTSETIKRSSSVRSNSLKPHGSTTPNRCCIC